MRTIPALIEHLSLELGEELLIRELEGILRKHRGLRDRSRRPGQVELCAKRVREEAAASKVPIYQTTARLALSCNLSQASVYRLVYRVQQAGVPLKGSLLLREMERQKRGVY
jgi:hypothetical protein